MEKELIRLINYLCIEWGLCIQSTDKTKILSLEILNSDQFACMILLAEGLDPETEIAWRRKIRNKFVEMIGSSQLNL